MSRVDSLSNLSACPDLDTSDELPELLQASGVSPKVQVGDIILILPPKCKARWPGLVEEANHKPKKGKVKTGLTSLPEVKRSLRIKNFASEMTSGFAFSYDILTVHLLNFPKAAQARRTINPPSKVEFYSSDKQRAIYSEWQKSKHIEYVPHLIKAIEEAETYLRKRIAHTLDPGTPVQQYMQVKRSRLDFDFQGLEHTDQDKQLRVGDISTHDAESLDNTTSDYLACVASPDPDSSLDKEYDADLIEECLDSRPSLSSEQFNSLTQRIETCREILREIYLGKRSSVKHKTYFCNNRQDKTMLHFDHLISFDSLPYMLDNGQKYDIHDIMVNFANEFVNQDPRKEQFSVASYAYDVLLPECTCWLTLELEKNPLTPSEINATNSAHENCSKL